MSNIPIKKSCFILILAAVLVFLLCSCDDAQEDSQETSEEEVSSYSDTDFKNNEAIVSA